MKAQIFEVKREGGEPETVVLRIERNADGNDFVKISAWHEDGEMLIYQESQMDFEAADNNFEMCERFVEDFSQKSAQAFYDSFQT